jgi:Putative Actinobacterial Holin-X, holin superfamily III
VATQESSRGRPAGDGSIRAEPPRIAQERQSTAELLRGLADDATTLFRQEILLARQEVTEGITSSAKASALLIAAAVFGLFAFGFLLATIASAIGGPDWIGLLIVGGGLLIIAGLLALIGRFRLTRTKVSPDKARAELRETAKGLKEELSNGRNRGGNRSGDRVDTQAHGGQSGQTV